MHMGSGHYVLDGSFISDLQSIFRTCGQKQTGLLQKVEELDLLQGLEAWLSLEDSLNELSALDALAELFLVWLYIPASKIGVTQQSVT